MRTYAKTYKTNPRQLAESNAPTQSMSLIRLLTENGFESFEMAQTPANSINTVRPAQVYHPSRHVALSAKMPPKKSPREKPTGCPPPRHANPILRCLPVGKLSVRMLTVFGRHMDTAMPCKALKPISWRPVCARPQAAVNSAKKKQPNKKMLRLPKRSAMEPTSRREQPHVSAYTEDGQRSKLWARCNSSAIFGSATVSIPVLILLTVVTPAIVAMSSTVRPVDGAIFSGVRSGRSSGECVNS